MTHFLGTQPEEVQFDQGMSSPSSQDTGCGGLLAGEDTGWSRVQKNHSLAALLGGSLVGRFAQGQRVCQGTKRTENPGCRALVLEGDTHEKLHGISWGQTDTTLCRQVRQERVMERLGCGMQLETGETGKASWKR